MICANAMGTSVGSGVLTIKQAVFISIVADTLGAVLAGGYVTSTISKGMINPTLFAAEPNRLMFGMFAALLAAGIWVNLATCYALPVSTTHAIVGAVIGFGIISVGAGAVSWNKVIKIAMSWIISPAAGAILAGGIYYFAERKILNSEDPVKAAEYHAPFLVFLVLVVLILSIIFKALKNLHLEFGFFKLFYFQFLLRLLPPPSAVDGYGGKSGGKPYPAFFKMTVLRLKTYLPSYRYLPPVMWPLHMAPTTWPMPWGRWRLSFPC